MQDFPIGGLWGKVLVVDVGTGEQRVEDLDAEAARDFIGGRGLAAYYLFNMLPAGADPLAPENPVIFASGPLGHDRPRFGSGGTGHEIAADRALPLLHHGR